MDRHYLSQAEHLIYSKSKYILQTIIIIEKFDLKRDNKNIKVTKNCPTLVTVLIEFRVHSFENGLKV